jgi:hypothetical protein
MNDNNYITEAGETFSALDNGEVVEIAPGTDGEVIWWGGDWFVIVIAGRAFRGVRAVTP